MREAGQGGAKARVHTYDRRRRVHPDGKALATYLLSDKGTVAFFPPDFATQINHHSSSKIRD